MSSRSNWNFVYSLLGSSPVSWAGFSGSNLICFLHPSIHSGDKPTRCIYMGCWVGWPRVLCWFHRFYMVMRFFIYFLFLKNEYRIRKFSKVYCRVRHLIQTLHTMAFGLTNHRRQRLLDHLHATRRPPTSLFLSHVAKLSGICASS
jgi:hypothetical protein